MLRLATTLLAAFSFCFISLASGLGSTAYADSPSSADWSNPFCEAVGHVFPSDHAPHISMDGGSDEYELSLWANARSSFSARMTLLDTDSAYEVDIPRTNVSKGPAGTGSRWPFLISFDRDVKISEYFVDAVSIDGAPMTDCPSFVHTVTSDERALVAMPQPSDYGHLTARFLQKLPPVPCGSRFSGIKATHTYEPLVGHYGDRPRDVAVEVFVDSSGTVSEARIWRSSGVEGLDAAALGGAQLATYQPAKFLCTPVVGYAIIRFDYEP